MNTAVDWESFIRMESWLVCDQDGQETRWEIATMVQEMSGHEQKCQGFVKGSVRKFQSVEKRPPRQKYRL